MTFDKNSAEKIKRGALLGYIFIAVAAAGLLFFAVCYPVARAKDMTVLLYLSCVLSPVLIAAGAAGAAACNLSFGRKSDELISKYVLDVILENPQTMHPERDSLTFYISQDGCIFSLRANGYKESLSFDFGAFKKLSLSLRADITSAICNRLIETFCRLYTRGASYREVSYSVQSKKSKTVPIIVNGEPDKKAFKIYLKSARS